MVCSRTSLKNFPGTFLEKPKPKLTLTYFNMEDRVSASGPSSPLVFKNSFRNTTCISVKVGLHRDQDGCSVGPDLVPNCL